MANNPTRSLPNDLTHEPAWAPASSATSENWHAEAPTGDEDYDEDYDEYMVLTAGNGRTCVSDRKSQSEFSLMVDENGVHMGSYEFGGGDSLEVSADELRLVRRGEQKGVTYVTEYARVRGTWPTWCVEQLSDAPPDAEQLLIRGDFKGNHACRKGLVDCTDSEAIT